MTKRPTQKEKNREFRKMFGKFFYVMCKQLTFY